MPYFQHVPPQLAIQNPCPIAFLAEAPGDEETRKGVPLVGPSGRVFNAMLRAANLDRDLFHITNVFDEKADDNEVGPWLADKVRMEESAARLKEEFDRCKPNVIVPMGGTALSALTGHSGIAGFRGAVLPASRIVPGTKLLPTFHPAAVMRQWKFMPFVVGDLVKAYDEAMRGPKITYPKVEILIEPSVADIEAFAQECLVSDLLSTDIETGWGQITCIGFAPTPSRAMCIPFFNLLKPNRSYWGSAETEVQVWKIVRDILQSPVPKLGQNFNYDAMWLLEKMGIRCNNYLHDTRLLAHANFPELPKDLATLGANYTRLGNWKSWAGHKKQEKRDA